MKLVVSWAFVRCANYCRKVFGSDFRFLKLREIFIMRFGKNEDTFPDISGTKHCMQTIHIALDFS